MKKSKKVVALSMAMTALLTVCFSACQRGNQDVSGDNNSGGGNISVNSEKTQLYVFNYDGGIGHVWMDKLISRFEETYKDTEFEEGKKGVQVIPTYLKDAQSWTGDGLIAKLPDAQESIIFTESVYYNDLIEAGVVKDISEWVTTPLSEYGETRSIADKIRGTQKEYLDRDGKYWKILCVAFLGRLYGHVLRYRPVHGKEFVYLGAIARRRTGRNEIRAQLLGTKVQRS